MSITKPTLGERRLNENRKTITLWKTPEIHPLWKTPKLYRVATSGFGHDPDGGARAEVT
ncbi:hypothetical protein [Mobiluncus mulieris]|uniref:hypothetical protein n=1 Tax=Mobiluncus mulieris TaxID=2052 RepID=UPI00019F8E10|nr:hypothetical protein [Mobiluncus mulieris]EEJ53072.1 hypothetical protein HMPREF0577_1972 [Mobiluncus mulieris ATCC 35243]NMW91658.1 hypothetical protein [Mobiluncus mulieris]